MTYDLHGAWEKFTGENAPLHARGAEHGDARQLNVVSPFFVCLSLLLCGCVLRCSLFFSISFSLCHSQAGVRCKMTSYPHRCDMKTSHRRQYHVVLSPYVRWIFYSFLSILMSLFYLCLYLSHFLSLPMYFLHNCCFCISVCQFYPTGHMVPK